MRYEAIVTREGKNWLVDVPSLQGTHTWAPNLVLLEKYTREVIVLGADLSDEDLYLVEFDFVFETGDVTLDRELGEARVRRIELERLSGEVLALTKELSKKLTKRGWSVRDVGFLLGISPQRVSQLSPLGRARG